MLVCPKTHDLFWGVLRFIKFARCHEQEINKINPIVIGQTLATMFDVVFESGLHLHWSCGSESDVLWRVCVLSRPPHKFGESRSFSGGTVVSEIMIFIGKHAFRHKAFFKSRVIVFLRNDTFKSWNHHVWSYYSTWGGFVGIFGDVQKNLLATPRTPLGRPLRDP